MGMIEFVNPINDEIIKGGSLFDKGILAHTHFFLSCSLSLFVNEFVNPINDESIKGGSLFDKGILAHTHFSSFFHLSFCE